MKSANQKVHDNKKGKKSIIKDQKRRIQSEIKTKPKFLSRLKNQVGQNIIITDGGGNATSICLLKLCPNFVVLCTMQLLNHHICSTDIVYVSSHCILMLHQFR